MLLVVAAWLIGLQVGIGQDAVMPTAPAVVLQVTMPSGSVNRLTVAPGRHGSVGSVSGPRLDLKPALKDDGSLEIVVTTCVRDAATGTLVANDVERQVVQPGDVARFAASVFPIEVKWLATVAVPASGQPATAGPDGDRCCVVCGADVTCGCEVITPCGDCCVGTCGCQDGGIKRLE